MNYSILKLHSSHTVNIGRSSKQWYPVLWTYLSPVTSYSL